MLIRSFLPLDSVADWKDLWCNCLFLESEIKDQIKFPIDLYHYEIQPPRSLMSSQTRKRIPLWDSFQQGTYGPIGVVSSRTLAALAREINQDTRDHQFLHRRLPGNGSTMCWLFWPQEALPCQISSVEFGSPAWQWLLSTFHFLS